MPRITEQALELKSIRDKMDRHYKMSEKDDVKVMVPASVRTSAILAIKPTNIADDKLWQGGVFYILHSIISKTERKKFKFGNKTKGFVGLRHEYLRNVIGIHTKLTIDVLVTNGIIERDNKYITGVEPMGYRLSEIHRKSKTKVVTISNAAIIKRYKVVEEKLHLEHRQRLRDHAHLIKWLLNNDLKIDTHAATEYLDLYSRRLKRIFKKYNLKKDVLDEVYANIDNTVNSSLNLLNKWDNQKPTIDSKGGRLYTSLTGIMSQLRNYIKYKDENLVSFDLKNSQPYHLIAMTQPEMWNKTRNKKELNINNLLDSKILEYIQQTNKQAYYSSIMMLKEYSKAGKNIVIKGLARYPATSPHYAKLVANGKLYKFISDHFKGKFITTSGYDPFSTKDLAKKEMIKMFYFNPKETYSPSKIYFAQFKKLFPTEGAIIELLKSRTYQDFSILLQKVESTILLKNICKTIFNTDSKIPIYTIHDSIITTENGALLVEKIIKDTYKELIGVEPDLRKEEMNPQNAVKQFDKYITKKTIEICKDLGIEYKEEKAKMTLEDLQDVVKSKCFKKAKPIELHDLIVVMPLPWEN